MHKLSSVLLATVLLATALTGCGGSSEGENAGSSRLNTVKNRGKLVCGVEGNIPGF